MKCNFCDKVATWEVHGWAEDGTDEGPAFQPVCDDHVIEFQEYDNDSGEYIHGMAYITEIIKVFDI